MKIQCDVCEKAEAEVLCCADEAVLCKGCDANVHAANKLFEKHQRLLLLKHPSSSSSTTSCSSSSQLPLCETCQERKGYIFCLEDRALLCRQCDISTHAASPYVLSHQRFLISDVKVSLQSTENSDVSFSSNTRNHPSRLAMPMDISFDFPADKENMTAMTIDLEAASTETTATFPGEPQFATEPHWPFDEVYGTSDFNFYDYSEVGSSRMD
ncbi:unnamed protein product [Dovyalis caffra]|uniref:B box-type domain-containing protein n=1 Tax=Dovyalis caffra TaxID=77055 RepID=A0AAV1RX33_9ROSI|nr:unnamed protein product [Dovyalis caffra]